MWLGLKEEFISRTTTTKKTTQIKKIKDHDDDHARTCHDARTRQACLQAKFTYFSLPQAHDH